MSICDVFSFLTTINNAAMNILILLDKIISMYIYIGYIIGHGILGNGVCIYPALVHNVKRFTKMLC